MQVSEKAKSHGCVNEIQQSNYSFISKIRLNHSEPRIAKPPTFQEPHQILRTTIATGNQAFWAGRGPRATIPSDSEKRPSTVNVARSLANK